MAGGGRSSNGNGNGSGSGSGGYGSIFRPDLFKGKVALVTGGASGIGRCVALELASLGATVVIASRSKAKLVEAQALLAAQGAHVDYQAADIRVEEQVDALVKQVLQQHGKIDFLVNSAGGQFFSPAENISSRGWDAVVRLNLTGTWTVCRKVFDLHMAEHGGSIVTLIADMWNGFPGMAHTGAARAAVMNLTQTLSVEWGRNGVRINCVAPGSILGNGLTNYPEEVQRILATFTNENPTGRLGSEEEISAAVVFLLSPAASYINGTCIKVDGGSSLLRGVIAGFGFPESKIPMFEALPEPLRPTLTPVLLDVSKNYTKIKSSL